MQCGLGPLLAALVTAGNKVGMGAWIVAAVV